MGDRNKVMSCRDLLLWQKRIELAPAVRSLRTTLFTIH